ncbi:YmfQ family protein [Pseudogulbenkiania sp. MAI-1]|uniref:YmfQ family protein n=1 Tax=Pseudogulbenkiania sp. MAI-1 TaxID=990370 RepID=UPI00045E6A2F|nr:putative phage tail protein [Pseudogulbenkiania sp. MAI-1]
MAVSADRYRQQLQALLPPGIALQAEPDSELDILLSRLAGFLGEVDASAQIVLAEADPLRALKLLPEWEASLGLPDSCTVGEQTLLARQQAVVAKLTDTGGARIPRYLRIANALGYPDATINRFRDHTCELTCEDPVCEREWRFVWRLDLPSGTRLVDSTCESGCEEPIRTWGDTMLDCVIHREAPATGTVLISYGGN